MHTALHGHLRYLCERGQIDYAPEDTMTALFKKLRSGHPALVDLGPRGRDIERVLNASATIIDALNPLRNRASVAHPTSSRGCCRSGSRSAIGAS